MKTPRNRLLQPKSRSGHADPRRLAVGLLNEVEQGRRTLDALLEDVERRGGIPDSRDRDLFNALVFGVLRWRGRLDHVIAHFSKTPLDRIDLPVLNILRAGLFQVIHLTRIPPSAAVHTAVELAKTMSAPWVASFVNAILRRASEGYDRVPFPDFRLQPAPALAATHSFPMWLVERWIQRYGCDATKALCDTINSIPPLTLRANTIKMNRTDVMAALLAAGAEVDAAVHAPDGIHVRTLKGRLKDLPAFQQGWFQVQDEAAQLVSLLVDPQPGESVLDACAGRGGKTGHMAQLMQNQGSLAAMDNNASRLADLRAELRRLGISNATIFEADLESPALDSNRKGFDRILVDAPCTGLGTLRRNPDIKWAAGKRDLGRFGKIQLALLEQASTCLKSRGVLVYAVCTCEPEETIDVVKSFLAARPAFIVESEPQLPEPVRSLLTPEGFLQTYPCLGYMDGFFAVRLKRTR